MTRFRLAVLVLCLASGGTSPRAQQTQAPVRSPGTVQAATTAVLVDVVVRDKRGQPVTDLTAADFEIHEDGVLQEIGAITLYTRESSVRLATREAGAAPASPEPAAAKASPEPPPEAVIALVFDRLAPEARAVAHKAALGYISQLEQNPSLVGVFGIDLSLSTYQSYTRDTARLR